MAESTFTQTGVNELRAAINRFPDVVTARLQAVAAATAARVKASAYANLRSRQKTDATALADAIEIVEDLPNKQYQVVSKPPKGQPANVTIWNEYGTVKMGARPYMLLAAKGEETRYTNDMQAAADAAMQESFGG